MTMLYVDALARKNMRNRVSPQLDLHKDFYHAAKDNEPQQNKAHIGAKLRGHDEFTRTNDRSRDNQARAELLDHSGESGGSIVQARLNFSARLEILLSHRTALIA